MTSICRTAIVAVAISVVATACGSGGAAGHASGHVAIRAAVRWGACLPGHPGLSPYRGMLVLVRSDGRRVRVDVAPNGRVRKSLAPGGYRLVLPLAGSTVHLELDGQPVATTGQHYPLRIVAGETARLAVVILPRRGDCTSSGVGA
jgi:hypothetical protein